MNGQVTGLRICQNYMPIPTNVSSFPAICLFFVLNVAENKQTASVSYFLRWNVSPHHTFHPVDNMLFLDFQQLGVLKCSLRLAFPPADVFPVTFASFSPE